MQGQSFVPNPLGEEGVKWWREAEGFCQTHSLGVGKKHSLLAEYYPYSGLPLPCDQGQKEDKIHISVRKEAKEALPIPLSYEKESPTRLSLGHPLELCCGLGPKPQSGKGQS